MILDKKTHFMNAKELNKDIIKKPLDIKLIGMINKRRRLIKDSIENYFND